MKKRIGWLNNKPIIQGDKNLKNSNELHIDELSSNNSEGGSNVNEDIQYYKIDGPSLSGTAYLYYLALGTLFCVKSTIMKDNNENDSPTKAILGSNMIIRMTQGYPGNGVFDLALACEVIDIDNYFINTPNGAMLVPKGNVFDKIKYVGELTGMEMVPDTSAFVQITKEEYESLITVKPE